MPRPIRGILVVCYNCVVIGMGNVYLLNVNVKDSYMNETLHWFRNFDLVLH